MARGHSIEQRSDEHAHDTTEHATRSAELPGKRACAAEPRTEPAGLDDADNSDGDDACAAAVQVSAGLLTETDCAGFAAAYGGGPARSSCS